MKNFLKTLILPIAFVTMLGGFAPSAFADSPPLSVTFTPDPLFVQANFLPLDETSGTVVVTNNSGTEQNILTEAINILDNDNFGSLLHLIIVGSSGILFDNSLSNFLSTAGEVSLGSIANGESKTYTYTVSFIDSSNNDYQGKTLGFDVCVGFQGGTSRCGNTVVGGENDTGSVGNGASGGTISGSGGVGSGSHILAIFNEQAGSVNLGAGTATIEWDTNLLSTSQVIYGPVSGPGWPYALNLSTLPNLGYPLGTVETPTKVLHHVVFLTGLSPGETYVYRVVSRASPPTVSAEHRFALIVVPPQAPSSPSGQAGSESSSWGNTFTTVGTVSISSPQADSTGSPQAGMSSEDVATGTQDLQLASALSGLPAGFLEFFQSFYFLIPLVILVALIVWFVRRRYRD